MPITHAVIHHLRRSDGQAELSMRPDELAVDGPAEILLAKLKSSFLARLSREHGRFRDDSEPPALPRMLRAVLEDDQSFLQTSSVFMETLRGQVDERRVTMDAHFLFFTEKSVGHHMFYLFAVNHGESLAISDTLDVTPSYAIETGSSLFGIKVDLAEWTERKNYAYVSLLRPRGNPLLAEVFGDITGFGNELNKEEATLAFLEGVETFSRNVPDEQVNEYRNQVVAYCMDQDEKDEPVDLQGLAKAVEGIDRDQFVQVMANHTPEAEELMVDRRSLRRYMKFVGRDRDLAITFSSYQLHHRIHYDPDTDTLSISGLPRALRDQLLAHMKGPQ